MPSSEEAKTHELVVSNTDLSVGFIIIILIMGVPYFVSWVLSSCKAAETLMNQDHWWWIEMLLIFQLNCFLSAHRELG